MKEFPADWMDSLPILVLNLHQAKYTKSIKSAKKFAKLFKNARVVNTLNTSDSKIFPIFATL